MSGIGDYVHLTWRGYLKSGTARRGKGASVDLQTAHNNQRALLNSQKASLMSGAPSKEELQRIEDIINYVLGDRSTISSNSSWDKDIETFQKVAKEELEKGCADSVLSINWETGKTFKNLSEEAIKQQGIVKEKIGKIKLKTATNYSTIRQRIEKIQQIQSQISEEARNKEGTTGYKLNALANKILDEYDRIIRMLPKGQRGQFINGSGRVNINSGGIARIGNVKSSILKDINDFSSFLASSQVASSTRETGLLTEYINAVVPAIGMGLSEDALREVLYKNQKGDNKTSYTIDKDFIANNIDYQSLVDLNIMEQTDENGSGFRFKTKYSKQKVDVEFEWEGKKASFSDKSIGLHAGSFGIGLVDGAPLLSLIQDSNADFINHYLNLYSSHLEYTKKDSEIGKSEKLSYITALLKETLLFKAISGATYGRENNAAKIFVFNNNIKKAGVEVYSINDLLDKASKNLNSYAYFKWDRGGKNAVFFNYRFPNEFAPTVDARITALISQLYAMKMDIGFNASMFI